MNEDNNFPDSECASKKYDAFISHASEDKGEIADPLATALKEMGFNIWYDTFELKVGDSQRRSIEEGLAQSRYGIVILSPKFFVKEWPQKELDGLVALNRVLLPVWHNLSSDEIKSYSPTLADIIARSTSESTIDEIAEVIRTVVSTDK